MTLPDKRVLIVSLFVGVLALSFWTSSRYPDLNRKAAVGGDMAVDGLGFDVAVKGTALDPWWKKTAIPAVNWGVTNKKGMTLGVFIAAGILTLFSLLKGAGGDYPFKNTLIGVLIGAPLGLCVKCATPIATG